MFGMLNKSIITKSCAIALASVCMMASSTGLAQVQPLYPPSQPVPQVQPLYPPAQPVPEVQPLYPPAQPVQPIIPQVQPAESAVRFYSAIYSHDDGGLNMPRYSHTFGGFIAYDHSRGLVVERFAISWMPANMKVRLFAGLERGRNVPLWETKNRAQYQGLDIRRWGPREITPELYMAAKNQWLRLERATVDASALYITVDPAYRNRSYQPAFNCIHALAGIVGDLELAVLHGRDASAEVDKFFSRYYRSVDAVYEIHQAFLNFEEGR